MNTKISTLLILPLFYAAAVYAEPAPATQTFSATVVRQWSADLDSGGAFAATRVRLQEGGKLHASRELLANWSLEVGITDYDFDRRASTAWEDIYQVGLNLSLIHPFNRHWSLLLVPGINASGEADADAGKALSYGLVTALNWQAADGLRLGLGGAVYENLGETQGFPLLMIDWQPAPGWRLANPLRSGVTGPAGLELSWKPTPNWTFGSGGTWRSLRFRLDEEGTSPGGAGEESGVPAWIRLTREFSRTQITLYAGATLNGSLTSEDRHGHEVSSSDYAETPFMALYFSGGF